MNALKKVLFASAFIVTSSLAFAQSNNINSAPNQTSPQPCQWQYGFDTSGTATATICGSTLQPSISIYGKLNAERPLAWYTNLTKIWEFGISTSDNIFALSAYDPNTGSYIGSPISFNSSLKQINRNWYSSSIFSGSPAIGSVMGATGQYTNVGGHTSQGEKLTYFSNAGADNTAGFDLAKTTFNINNGTSFPTTGFLGQETRWDVALSPSTVTAGNWLTAVNETDIVNRGADQGLRTIRTTANFSTNAFLAVPEAKTFGSGGNTYNADWGYVVDHSSTVNPNTGLQNKFYIGYFVDADAIVGNAGYDFYGNGDNTSTPALEPLAFIGAGGAFQHGIDLSAATFDDTYGLKLGNGQGIAFVNGIVQASISTLSSGQSILIGTPHANAVLGSSSALLTTATAGFMSFPFMNGTPTGTPAYNAGGPSCVWNDTSKTLNCYSKASASWYHLTFTAGAG